MATRKVLLRRGVVLVLFYIFNTVRSERNVAVHKQTEPSSNYAKPGYGTSKAVDNCTNTNFLDGCCIHTEPGHKTVWWRVDLGELTTITEIAIYYRDNYRDRFAGYQLYVSNTTNTPTDGVLCYENTNGYSIRLVVTHQCPYVGRYVTLYNYRDDPKRYSWYSNDALLELCEVQVFGCQVGRYGDGHCNNQCSGACYGGNCNAKTGACFYCVPQKYGIRCEQDCSTDCMGRLCDVNGSCYGCISGKFGNSCELNCPGNCTDICGKDTGHCLDCVPQKYGVTCDQDCSANCLGRLCEKTNGICKECIPGKYGINCDQNCPRKCKDMLCERDTGFCNGGCVPGRHDVKCTLPCPVTCKNFLCDQHTGQCLDCYPGKYGEVCGADCPKTCTDNICSKDDGQCLTTESPNTNQSSADSNLTTIAVLAVGCGLLFAAVIALAAVICRLRKKLNTKKSSDKDTEQSVPDTGYTSFSPQNEEIPHVYEMMVT